MSGEARRSRRWLARALCAALLSLVPAIEAAATAASHHAVDKATRVDRARALEASHVERVLALENERLALMPAVAAWKWQHHAPVTDAARERAILAGTAQLARPLGLDVAPVERLFELQMRLARGVESDLLGEWRTRGFHFDGPVPDLGRELRPRLDHVTAMLLRALQRAAPAFNRPGFADRYAAAAARGLNARGWTPRTRRELLDALSAIRRAPEASRPADRPRAGDQPRPADRSRASDPLQPADPSRASDRSPPANRSAPSS